MLCPPLDGRTERMIIMANVIAVIILAVLIGGSIAYIVREKKRGVRCIGCPAGGSCPSSGKKPKKKLEGRVIGKKTMTISGMHCAHCASDVTMILNRIDGVSADVNLSKGRAVISLDREVGDDVLKSAVEKIGYQVTGIS